MCVDTSRSKAGLPSASRRSGHHSPGACLAHGVIQEAAASGEPDALGLLKMWPLAKACTPPVKKACPLAAAMNWFAAQLAPEHTLLPPPLKRSAKPLTEQPDEAD